MSMSENPFEAVVLLYVCLAVTFQSHGGADDRMVDSTCEDGLTKLVFLGIAKSHYSSMNQSI